MNFKKISVFVITLFFLLPFYQSCIEPVDGEFDLQAGLIFIDGFALTEMGLSTVTITESVFEFQTYKVINVPSAIVKIENINSGETVDFAEDASGIYTCPPDFAAEPGEVWKLLVEFENGKKVESKPQTVVEAVPIAAVNVEYAPDIEFNADFGEFVPGHRVSIDWQDPAGEENFYLWKYRTFEPLFVCRTCENRSVLRNGECQPTGQSFGPQYYNYLCNPQCWQIKFGNELPIFEDRLEDGVNIQDREIIILPFYRRPDILIEIQQFSLDKDAFEYFKVISDQVSESGGLNAPPPAALLGNLFNPDDSSDLILGQFTTAGVSTKSLYIDRALISESPIRPDDPIIIEPCATCPTQYPCMESAFRTAVKPDGWP